MSNPDITVTHLDAHGLHGRFARQVAALISIDGEADATPVDVGEDGAFSFPLPDAFYDAKPHSIAIEAEDSGGLIVQMVGDPMLVQRRNEPLPASLPIADQVLQSADMGAPADTSASTSIAPFNINRTVAMSVIMPTYNRGEVMELTIRQYIRAAEQSDAELIVVDDGSSDDTPDRLKRLTKSMPRLVIERVPNGGPAGARNLAASMARGNLLVFVGDDVVPVSDDFLAIHAAAHARHPKVGQAVLGKISWPNADALGVNFVMSHIQGDGHQQFGYKAFKAYTWLGWQFFYSSNVSVKKALVSNWMTEGYDSSFYLAAFEDADFGLRMTERLRQQGEQFGIFYVPAAHSVHFHHYDSASFIARQVSAGMMAKRFLELHPMQAKDLGLDELIARLNLPMAPNPLPVEHYFSVFEGLKSWALVIENHYGLGQQNWHGDLLLAVFQLAYFEGFLRVQSDINVNVPAACRYILETMRNRLNRAIVTEVLGDVPGFGLV